MTHTPLLLLLLLLSVYAKYSLEAAQVATHSDDVRVVLGTAVKPGYTELEALEQATRRDLMANPAELRELNSRLANVERKVPDQFGQESGQRSSIVEDVRIDAMLLPGNVLSTGEWSREISRSLFNTMIGNPSSYLKGTRIDPAIKDGKAIGFKLSVIRPGSLLTKLGFVNGDLLHSLNGKELELGPHHCGNLYGWLKQQSSLSFGITRNDKEETIVISIVENEELDVRFKNLHTNEDSNSQLFADNVRSTGEWSRAPALGGDGSESAGDPLEFGLAERITQSRGKMRNDSISTDRQATKYRQRRIVPWLSLPH